MNLTPTLYCKQDISRLGASVKNRQIIKLFGVLNAYLRMISFKIVANKVIYARIAAEAGNEVEEIRVATKKIAPCIGCYYCAANGGKCVHNDDMAEILRKMIEADVIVLASPVYFYSVDAQIKAVIDRTVARWLEVKNKEFYYIVTMADPDRSSADTALACFRGYADCVEGAEEKGIIIGSGAHEPGEIKNSPALKQAYDMGKGV